MPTRIVALFNLRPGIDTADYERWARAVDLPTVTGRLGADTPSPYAYAEIIDVRDMDVFGRDVATSHMQSVAADFARLAETMFLTTEKLV